MLNARRVFVCEAGNKLAGYQRENIVCILFGYGAVLMKELQFRFAVYALVREAKVNDLKLGRKKEIALRGGGAVENDDGAKRSLSVG